MTTNNDQEAGTDIMRHPVHLGLGATAAAEPDFTGEIAWYDDYLERHAADGREARLVSAYTFSEPWDMWEMHPEGAEVVLCISGSMTLLQEQSDGSVLRTRLARGQYAINAPGTWHTADVDQETTAVFITAGLGTQHRPRDSRP